MKLRICLLFILLNSVSWGIEVSNQSAIHDSTAQQFLQFLSSNGYVHKDFNGKLVLHDLTALYGDVKLEVKGYVAPFPVVINANIRFELASLEDEVSYSGLVLMGQCYFEVRGLYMHLHPETSGNQLIDLKERYLKPKNLLLGFSNQILDQNKKKIGTLELQFKTLTRKGLMVTENYELIGANHYFAMTELDFPIEPVLVFYTASDEAFNAPGVYTGKLFEMVDLNLNVIHKGIVSEYDFKQKVKRQ